MLLAHALCLALAGPAPAAEGPTAPTNPTLAPAPATAADAAPHRPRGFVVASTLGFNFVPVYPVPSAELSLFLGGALPITARRPGHWAALGYRGTLSLGSADLLLADNFGLVHRHHLAVHGAAGPRARLYYGASLGLVVVSAVPMPPDGDARHSFGVEGDARLGAILGRGAAQLIVGAQLRVSAPLAREDHRPVAFPTLGVFVGFNFGPDLRPAR